MSLKKYAVLAALAAVLPVQVANAQVSQLGSTLGAEVREKGSVSEVSVNRLNLTAPEALLQQGGARQPLPQRGFFIKTHIGAWTSSGNGLTLGAGIAALPFNGPQHEVTANGSWARVEDSNGWMFDGNYLFNFALDDGQRFTPYAGLGLNVSHFDACGDLDDFDDDFDDFFDDLDDVCDDTATGLQIGGGVKRPFGTAGREIFGELFIVLTDNGPVVIRGGVNW